MCKYSETGWIVVRAECGGWVVVGPHMADREEAEKAAVLAEEGGALWAIVVMAALVHMGAETQEDARRLMAQFSPRTKELDDLLAAPAGAATELGHAMGARVRKKLLEAERRGKTDGN